MYRRDHFVACYSQKTRMPEFALPQAAPTIGPAIAELLREPSCSLAPLVAGVVRNENYYMAAAADGIERYLERRGGEGDGGLAGDFIT